MSNVAFKLFVVLGEAETDEARHIWERVAGHGWISCSEVWNGGNNIKHPINETLNFASSFFCLYSCQANTASSFIFRNKLIMKW